MDRNLIGKTFALTQCNAWTWDDNQEVTISGLYMIEDLVYSDRSCGQCESGYWIFPAENADKGEGPMFFVDWFTFFEQVDPKGYGRMLVCEREMEFASEGLDVAELFRS